MRVIVGLLGTVVWALILLALAYLLVLPPFAGQFPGGYWEGQPDWPNYVFGVLFGGFIPTMALLGVGYLAYPQWTVSRFTLPLMTLFALGLWIWMQWQVFESLSATYEFDRLDPLLFSMQPIGICLAGILAIAAARMRSRAGRSTEAAEAQL